jgi:hypothetical protein
MVTSTKYAFTTNMPLVSSSYSTAPRGPSPQNPRHNNYLQGWQQCHLIAPVTVPQDMAEEL